MRALEDAMVELAAAAEGRLTVAQYMQAALYHPTLGYYRRSPGPLAAPGDFVTSPLVHGAFARLLAWQTEEVWSQLGRPGEMRVVDAGAAHGVLLEGIREALRAHAPECFAASSLSRLEVGDDAEALLAQGTPTVLWANELLDAFPVHQVAWRERRGSAGWVERYLLPPRRRGEAWRTSWGPLSDPDLPAECARLPRMGVAREVGLPASRWLERCGRALRLGALIFIDYARRPRPSSQFRAYLRHQLVAPFHDPGSRDLTAPVDLDSLTRSGERAGLHHLGVTTQSAFLRQLGLGALSRDLLDGAPLRARRVAESRALQALAEPSGLGGFAVFGWSRGLAGASLAGFSKRQPVPPWLVAPASAGLPTYDQLLPG